MANRLNDTDPQSPRALGSKTDPGLGQAPAVVVVPRDVASPVAPQVAEVTPSPGSASMEELIDGITGPRPPSSSRPPRRLTPRPAAPLSDTARAYIAARAAPPSQPTPPEEPSVLTPEPPLYSGVGGRPARDLEVPRKVEPESTRPVIRKPGEERTVHTGRRALVRNLAAVIASSAAVAVMMMSIMRWKEAQRPHRASEVVVLPAIADDTSPSAGAVQVEKAPAPIATVAVEALPVEPTASPAEATSAVPTAKPASSAQKRARSGAKGGAASAASLDDLNRQIRH